MKGETIKKLIFYVEVIREEAIKPQVETRGAVDLYGTGGDSSGTFNISTASMFIMAGAGVFRCLNDATDCVMIRKLFAKFFLYKAQNSCFRTHNVL